MVGGRAPRKHAYGAGRLFALLTRRTGPIGMLAGCVAMLYPAVAIA